MDKYYALVYSDIPGVLYTIADSRYSNATITPGKNNWQKKLDKKGNGNAPQIAMIMRSDRAEEKYRIEGNRVYSK